MAEPNYNTMEEHINNKREKVNHMTKKDTVIMYSLAFATFTAIILGSIEVLTRG